MSPENGDAVPGPQEEAAAPSRARRSTLNVRSGGRWHSALREPLFHFFAVGALVFGAYAMLNDEPPAEDGQKIEISADDVRQMVVAWLAQGRPALTRDQLQSLVDQKVAEEVLFREGLALGLDRNDEIIKRRVAQKMDFLAADVAGLQEPEKADLLEWYSLNSERFSLPPRASFRHLYFSPDQRGGNAQGDAKAALEVIVGKAVDSPEVADIADAFILRNYYSNTSPDQILKEFGPVFAEELFKLAPGDWRGPIQSGYGWHLVRIESVVPARAPTFDEVETDVRTAWRDEQFQKIKRDALEEMRSHYTVVVPPLEMIDMSNLLGTAPADATPPDAATQ